MQECNLFSSLHAPRVWCEESYDNAAMVECMWMLFAVTESGKVCLYVNIIGVDGRM